jgi:hypothetical protein
MSAKLGLTKRTRLALPSATNITAIAPAIRHPRRRWHRAHIAVYSATVMNSKMRPRLRADSSRDYLSPLSPGWSKSRRLALR